MLSSLKITCTGYVTGAIYNDANLRKNGFPAENIYDGSVIAIKTHFPTLRYLISKQDLLINQDESFSEFFH